jgi:phosphate uptake regulator
MEMASTNLQEELGQLGDELCALAAAAAEAVTNAAMMLQYNDAKAALALRKSSELINARRLQIQGRAYSVRVAQRPFGRDLRLLTSIPDVCKELDRIGWYAQAIAELAARRDGPETPALFADLQLMAFQAANIVQGAVRTFVNQDPLAAQFIAAQVALVEASYNKIYCEGLDHIVAEPASREHVRLIFTAAHNLQCVARHIAPVWAGTMFVATGDRSQPAYMKADKVVLAVQ